MTLFKKRKNQCTMTCVIQPIMLSELDAALTFAMQAYFEAGGQPFTETPIVINPRHKEWVACYNRFNKEIDHFSKQNKES